MRVSQLSWGVCPVDDGSMNYSIRTSAKVGEQALSLEPILLYEKRLNQVCIC